MASFNLLRRARRLGFLGEWPSFERLGCSGRCPSRASYLVKGIGWLYNDEVAEFYEPVLGLRFALIRQRFSGGHIVIVHEEVGRLGVHIEDIKVVLV